MAVISLKMLLAPDLKLITPKSGRIGEDLAAVITHTHAEFPVQSKNGIIDWFETSLYSLKGSSPDVVD